MGTEEVDTGLSSLNISEVVKGNVTKVDSKINIINFHGKLLEHSFVVQIWNMGRSFFVWIGLTDGAPSMSNLCVAMPTCFESYPLVSGLIGSDTDSHAMAQRLSKRTGKQMFVSCNLPDIPQLIPYVEKQIASKIN